MSKLREAAQAVVDKHNPRTNMSDWWDAIDHLRAALALPETEAEPVAEPGMWMNRYGATMKTRDRVTANAMGFTIPLYAHPPRNEWRPASEPPDSDRLVIVWVADDRSPSNGGYFCTDCLRPSRANPDARIWASIGVTHWRDVQPPTECSK